MSTDYNLDSVIRKIKDFPKKGILFYDITSILSNPEAFSYCIDKMVETYIDKKIDSVAAVEARGFLFAAPFAQKMGIPLVLIRKKGKLPGPVMSKKFDLEYGDDEIQLQKSDISPGDKVLIVDDLIATGGTLKAAAELISDLGAKVEDIFGVIGLPFLKYEELLNKYNVKTLHNYYTENV